MVPVTSTVSLMALDFTIMASTGRGAELGPPPPGAWLFFSLQAKTERQARNTKGNLLMTA
jgi:hypothetical protein